MSGERYEHLIQEERVRLQDEIIDLVQPGASPDDVLEFDDSYEGDTLVLKWPPIPEVQQALKDLKCVVKSDEAKRTVIVLPEFRRSAETVLVFWRRVSYVNLVALAVAICVYAYFAHENQTMGF